MNGPVGMKLFGGPQDGARVVVYEIPGPSEIFVQREWQGDQFAAWGRERCDRFPVRYVAKWYGFDWELMQ